MQLEEAYEAVIGIECHIQLNTASKAFCSCKNEYGGSPNEFVCPVCMGHPVRTCLAGNLAWATVFTFTALGCMNDAWMFLSGRYGGMCRARSPCLMRKWFTRQ